MPEIKNNCREKLQLNRIDNLLEVRISYDADLDKNGRSYFLSELSEVDLLIKELTRFKNEALN